VTESTGETREFAGMSGDEELLVRAHRRCVQLAGQLVSAPFTAETLAALRAYLGEDAEPAVRIWAELQQLPPEALRARLEELCRVNRSQGAGS
jgi:hypothetical protein